MYKNVCIFTIAIMCQCIIIFLSILVGIGSKTEWWWLWMTYNIGAVGGWYIHRLGHRYPISTTLISSRDIYTYRYITKYRDIVLDVRKKWFNAHTIGHHAKTYPLNNFTKSKILLSPEPNEPYYYPIYFFLVFSTLLLRGLSCCIMVSLVLCEAALWNSWLHDQYHLKDSRLERYEWFLIMREIHRKHHNLSKDLHYGIFDMTWDYILGTLSI